jgi:hypothetical protein
MSESVAKPARIGRSDSVANTPAILAEGLYKSYGKTHALDGADLRVEEGTILGASALTALAKRLRCAS